MADKDTPAVDSTHGDQFEAELPLPVQAASASSTKQADEPPISGDPAVDLIRKKLADTYADEPPLPEEEKAVEKLETGQKYSKHQLFLEDLAKSGKPLPEAQSAWHEYYAGLPDSEKQQVWQEFYKTHQTTSSYRQEQVAAKAEQVHPAAFKPKTRRGLKVSRALQEAKKQTRHTITGVKQMSPKQGIRSLGFGLVAGALVILIFLFGFFNERFIAPLIQPSRISVTTPIITGGTISDSPQLLIPKINLAVPVVYGVTSTDTATVQSALNDGVVHYADTAQPGQDGNLVIIGHSSENIFNPGRYKYPFVLLHKLAIGDTFYIQKDGKRYVYVIYKREIVSPFTVSVLGTQDKPATATLITCDPPGTSTNRLVLVGEQISPSIADNQALTTQNIEAVDSPIIPGNSQTLWNRLYSWLTH